MPRNKIAQARAAATRLLAIAILISIGWLSFQVFSALNEIRSDMDRLRGDRDRLQAEVSRLQADLSAVSAGPENPQRAAGGAPDPARHPSRSTAQARPDAQWGTDTLEQRGHCLDAKTNEELEHIRDADGVLWPVTELPGDHTSCAVPWDVAVDTDGRVIVVVHLDESGKETEALGGRRSGCTIPAPENGSTRPLTPLK